MTRIFLTLPVAAALGTLWLCVFARGRLLNWPKQCNIRYLRNLNMPLGRKGEEKASGSGKKLGGNIICSCEAGSVPKMLHGLPHMFGGQQKDILFIYAPRDGFVLNVSFHGQDYLSNGTNVCHNNEFKSDVCFRFAAQ